MERRRKQTKHVIKGMVHICFMFKSRVCSRCGSTSLCIGNAWSYK